MPAEFDRCVKGGGKVRTMSGPDRHFGLSANEYIHICYPTGGGPAVVGEKKTKVKVEVKKEQK